MNFIPFKIWLHHFGIESTDEGVGNDEPFVWVFYYRVDGRELLESSRSQAELHLVAPPCHHGNVLGNQVFVQPFEGSIQPGGLGVLSLAGIHVVFLEEDGTPDDVMSKAHGLAVAEAQRQGSEVLRKALALDKTVSLALDQKAFRKAIQDGLAPEILETKIKVGVGAIVGLPFWAGEADVDDFVDNSGVTWGVADLIGSNDHEVEFTIGGTGKGHGQYYVRGSIRRTDTDEIPIIAAIKSGDDRVTLFARNLDDTLATYVSNDKGRIFTPEGLFGDPRKFRAGAAAAASADGRYQYVVGLSGEHYFQRRSKNHGKVWVGWDQLGEKEFKSAPAIACSDDGRLVHVVGRAPSDRYLHRVSKDFGETWSSWTTIEDAEFQSSPSIAVSPDGDRVVVFGTARQKVWSIGSNNHGETWGRWESIPVPIAHINGIYGEPMRAATSAPSAAFWSDSKTIRVACRGIDRTINWTESFDGGRSWTSYWHQLEGMRLCSAPVLLNVESFPCYFGLGETLQLQRGGNWAEPQDSGLEWKSVHKGPAPFHVEPFFY